MKKHSALALLVAAPLGVGALAAPVEGPDALEMRTEIVHYDAMAIQDRRSAEKLFFRFRQTAEEVCRLSSHPAGFEIWEERACEADAVAAAVRQADLPALDAYYNHRSFGALFTARR